MSDDATQPRRFMPKGYRQRHGGARLVERAADRPIRTRNKLYYRVLHWPVWIWVYFIAAGPITAALFAGEAPPAALVWLAIVVVGTGIATARGKLPGTEPKPYILRFGDDNPNPLYRRVSYTFAWSVIVAFAAINLVGPLDALVFGRWRIREMYDIWFFPLAGVVWLLGVFGRLPRAGRSTKNEGLDRRYFYGSIWAVTIGQTVLLALWKTLPVTTTTTVVKLVVYVAVLTVIGLLARFGVLPRTRPILAGEIAIAD